MKKFASIFIAIIFAAVLSFSSSVSASDDINPSETPVLTEDNSSEQPILPDKVNEDGDDKGDDKDDDKGDDKK